jgi:hypothetical protein
VAILLAVVVQVGVIGRDHVRVWHAAREGARVAAVDPDSDAIAEAAESSGLEPLTVTVDPDVIERRQGEPVTVRVAYSPSLRVPVIGHLFENLTLDADASMRIEQP